MSTFRTRPIEIEAIQFTGDNILDIWRLFGADGIYGPTEENPDCLILTTLPGGRVAAWVGDWVIPDSLPGTFYACKPDVFAATYESVTER